MIEDKNFNDDFEEELELEPFELLDDEDQDIVDDIYEQIMELGCPHCIKNLLAEFYISALTNGENSALLGVSDSLRDIVENR